MEEFVDRWKFVRSETLELLQSLNDEKLQFKPKGEKWQPLFYQFSCTARTQAIYAHAAQSGAMDFSLFSSSGLPRKTDHQTVKALLSFLVSSERQWLNALHANSDGVVWPDSKKSISAHIACLSEHERLHHGQLISYFTLAGFELPPNFKNNWAL
jgi:hypothetical protein